MNLNQLIKYLIIALFINNLVGIFLNLELVLLAIVFVGIGIPGIVFFFIYGIWCFEPRRKNPLLLLVMMSYNAFLIFLTEDLGLNIVDPEFHVMILSPCLFPLLNILLCLMLLITSLAAPKNLIDSSPQKPVYSAPHTESLVKDLLATFSGIVIILSLFAWLLFIYGSYLLHFSF